MIYVTHDQVEALTLGQRVAVMKAGVIQQVADPMTLYRQPANLFVAGFIGSPPMNFFHGTLLAKGGRLVFQETTLESLTHPGPSPPSSAAYDPSPALPGTLSPCQGERERERGPMSIPRTTSREACGSGGLSPARPPRIAVQLNDASAPPLRRYVGQRVVLGIRPENVACGFPPNEAPPGCTVEAVVEVIQPMGSEAYLYLAGHAHSFAARVRATNHFSVNQQVPLVFDMRRAHFFDSASEAAIV
jgi:multiple sugar transport system ATP-binding protein